MAKVTIDETILETIPEHLIRPLLVLSIRAANLHTVDECRNLINDVRKIANECSRAGGESLYYVKLLNAAEQRLQALPAVQRKMRKTDPTASVAVIDISRWSVYGYANGRDQQWFVSYKRGGLDRHTMEESIRTVISEGDFDYV